MATAVAFHGAAAQTGATFRGTVVRSDAPVPVAGAEVWIVGPNVHAQTDSTGRFELTGLAPGLQLVQVRRLGFVVKRDTITLIDGRITERAYALVAQAVALETVHTRSSQVRYLSPALRGFEQRRLSGNGGYFISDSALRANEGHMLDVVIESRIPAATIAPGPNGSRVMVSTRKMCRGSAMRSCRSPDCYPAVYIDGALVFYPAEADVPGGSASGQPLLPPPDLSRMGIESLAGVEYYPGAASSPIDMRSSQDGGCGTLWLWTRER